MENSESEEAVIKPQKNTLLNYFSKSSNKNTVDKPQPAKLVDKSSPNKHLDKPQRKLVDETSTKKLVDKPSMLTDKPPPMKLKDKPPPSKLGDKLQTKQLVDKLQPTNPENSLSCHNYKATGVPDESSEEKENNCDNKRLVVKIKSKAKSKNSKRKKSEDEELDNILCNVPCQKKLKISDENPEEVVYDHAQKLLHEQDITSTDKSQNSECIPSKNEEKPKHAISSFFKKVSKEERLHKVELDNTQLEVKVMVHNSPEEIKSGTISPICKSASESRRKTRRSNVARTEAETSKIDVIEVNEEYIEEPSEIEVELDPSMDVDEASNKISNQLSHIKEDTSVVLKPTDNSMIQSESDEGQDSQNEMVKSAFELLMKKPSKNSPLSSDSNTKLSSESEVVSILQGTDSMKKENILSVKEAELTRIKDKPIIKENTDNNLAGKDDSKVIKSASAFSVLMNASKRAVQSESVNNESNEKDSTDPVEKVGDIKTKKGPNTKSDTLVETMKNGKEIEDGKTENIDHEDHKLSDRKESESSLVVLVDSPSEVEIINTEDGAPSKSTIEKVSKLSNKYDLDLGYGKECASKKRVTPKVRMSASAFFVMMNAKKNAKADAINNEETKENCDKIQLNSNDDALSGVKPSSQSSDHKCSDKTITAPSGDSIVKNMLSVLQSVESDSSQSEDEMTVEVPRGRRRKRSKRIIDDEVADSEEPELVELTEDNEDSEDILDDVFEVRCKRAVGKLHLSKFISGGQGLSILYEESWYSPNQFEYLAGSRAKKYKASLFVNNKPIIKLLDAKNILTPTSSRSKSVNGRKTPDTDVQSSPVSRKQSGKQGKRRRNVIKSDSDNDKDTILEVNEESTEEESGKRISRRIAKNVGALEDKKRKQDELDIYLEGKFNKESEIKKIGKKQMKDAKKRKKDSSTSPSSSDSDCQVDQVIVKKDAGNVASIFMVGKKNKPVVEDPKITAARKAFLMSSAPDILKTLAKETEEVTDLPGVSFPSRENIHVIQNNEDNLIKLPKSQLKIPLSTESSLLVTIPDITAGHLVPNLRDEVTVGKVEVIREIISEADVLATIKNLTEKGGEVGKLFGSYLERRLEAESWEKEAREKKLSVQEVEEKRIRGNKRRSRRSRGVDEMTSLDQFRLPGSSGLMWPGKYQPRCGGDLLGNRSEVVRLKEWLQEWGVARKPSDTGSDWVSESEMSGSDMSSQPGVGNTAIIQGPSGVGKTASVFALAAELGFNVLEVNASSSRTGKQVMTMLQEATQSQQVKRSEEGKKVEKKNKTALILFKDVDIVFDDLDDGFYSAVNSLSQQTKRPIVLTTSDINFLYSGMDKVFKVEPTVFHFQPASSQELARHLQVLALVEGHSVCISSLTHLARWSGGVRKAVLQLQLLCQSGLVENVEKGADIDLNEDIGESSNIDLNKWFRHLASKTRRSGVVVEGRGLGWLGEVESYKHHSWWDDLPVRRGEIIMKEVRYPLVDGVGESQQYMRIDPLKNKDLFDSEASDDDEKDDKVNAEKSPKDSPAHVGMKPKTSAEISLWRQNQQGLSLLSSHLDIVSLLGPREDCSSKDSLSQHFQDHRDTKIDDKGMGVDVISLSGHQTAFRLSSLTDIEPIPGCEKFEVGQYKELYQEVFNSVCFIPEGKLGKGDIVSSVRGLARIDEHKKVTTGSGGRRQGRLVTTYLAQNEVFLGQDTLDVLCNALLV